MKYVGTSSGGQVESRGYGKQEESKEPLSPSQTTTWPAKICQDPTDLGVTKLDPVTVSLALTRLTKHSCERTLVP